jgi:hypothetical protein
MGAGQSLTYLLLFIHAAGKALFSPEFEQTPAAGVPAGIL